MVICGGGGIGATDEDAAGLLCTICPAELARHLEISIAADIDIYFCDPHSPWQRGTNENTNGLLRQYFPKGTDLSVYPAEILTAVADELNRRPRKTLNWKSPAQALAELLSRPDETTVATTS